MLSLHSRVYNYSITISVIIYIYNLYIINFIIINTPYQHAQPPSSMLSPPFTSLTRNKHHSPFQRQILNNPIHKPRLQNLLQQNSQMSPLQQPSWFLTLR